MAIAPPITKTKISTTAWGIPITNEVNRLTSEAARLDGLTKATAWVTVSLLNGWVHFSGQPVQYRKVGDMVEIRGRMSSGLPNNPAFNLPTGFRPPYNLVLVTGCDSPASWKACFIDLRADGNYIAFIPADMTSVACNHSFSISA